MERQPEGHRVYKIHAVDVLDPDLLIFLTLHALLFSVYGSDRGV